MWNLKKNTKKVKARIKRCFQDWDEEIVLSLKIRLNNQENKYRWKIKRVKQFNQNSPAFKMNHVRKEELLVNPLGRIKCPVTQVKKVFEKGGKSNKLNKINCSSSRKIGNWSLDLST